MVFLVLAVIQVTLEFQVIAGTLASVVILVTAVLVVTLDLEYQVTLDIRGSAVIAVFLVLVVTLVTLALAVILVILE